MKNDQSINGGFPEKLPLREKPLKVLRAADVQIVTLNRPSNRGDAFGGHFDGVLYRSYQTGLVQERRVPHHRSHAIAGPLLAEVLSRFAEAIDTKRHHVRGHTQ